METGDLMHSCWEYKSLKSLCGDVVLIINSSKSTSRDVVFTHTCTQVK